MESEYYEEILNRPHDFGKLLIPFTEKEISLLEGKIIQSMSQSFPHFTIKFISHTGISPQLSPGRMHSFFPVRGQLMVLVGRDILFDVFKTTDEWYIVETSTFFNKILMSNEINRQFLGGEINPYSIWVKSFNYPMFFKCDQFDGLMVFLEKGFKFEKI